MFSFSSLSLVATLALAAFTSAAPHNGHSHNDIKTGDVNVNNNIAPELEMFDKRAPCACAAPNVKSLVGIVTDVTVEITPIVAELSAVTKDTCTVEVVKPIAAKIVAVIDVAIKDVIKLKDYPVESVLKSVDGVLTVKEFCGLLGALLNLIFTAIAVVLSLLVKLEGEVFDLLCLIGITVGRLLHCILEVLASVTVQVLAILCQILAVHFWVIVKLRLNDLIVLLNINVKLFL